MAEVKPKLIKEDSSKSDIKEIRTSNIKDKTKRFKFFDENIMILL